MAVYLNVTDRYSLVEGDTFELFRTGVIMANDPYSYNWRVDCDKGAIYRRKYAYTPAIGDAGTYPMTMTIEDDWGRIVDRRQITLEVHPAPRPQDKPIHIACIGDSLTGGGQWVGELARRLTTSGASDAGPAGWGLPDVRFHGSVPTGYGAFHEGYGGWTFKSFNSDHESLRFWWVKPDRMPLPADQHADYEDGEGRRWYIETIGESEVKLVCRSYPDHGPSGTIKWVSGGESHRAFEILASRRASGNPFWDEAAGKVDFAAWARRVGAPTIDIACVLLGWNSSLTPEQEYLDDVRTFIRNLRAAFPTCHVVLMGIQVPSIDGFGQSYGCMWNFRTMTDYIANKDRQYKLIASEFENVSFHSLSGQFDCEYGYPYIEDAPNVRSSAKIIRQTNCVHPSDEGYMQVADAMTRAVVAEMAKL